MQQPVVVVIRNQQKLVNGICEMIVGYYAHSYKDSTQLTYEVVQFFAGIWQIAVALLVFQIVVVVMHGRLNHLQAVQSIVIVIVVRLFKGVSVSVWVS